jgi:hypothetical protein
MNEALANLSRTDGVLGVVVFDASGTCVANDLPPPYEPILMLEVLRRISASFDVFSSMVPTAPVSFGMDCEEGSLVVRRVDHNWVIALAQPNANMNLLNVAMNVVVLNLGRSGPRSGTQPAQRASLDSFSSRSSHMQSSQTAALEIPPDAIERGAVLQLLSIYKEFLGPAAKPVFKQLLAALGVTSRTLRKAQLGDLLNRMAAKIPVAHRQQEFLQQISDYRARTML